MKPTVVLTTILLLVSSILFAQETQFPSAKEKNQHKLTLFDKESHRIDVMPGFFEAVSNANANQRIVLQITKNTTFNGFVRSTNETKDFKIVSAKSLDYQGLTLLISKRISKNEPPSYRGMIFGKDYKDILWLEKDKESEKYIWIKKELSDILPD